jgi:hypothetical protein
MMHSSVRDGWAKHAEALADWAMARLVVRRDVYGHYPEGEGRTAHLPLTRDVLIRHFRGEITIGAHFTSPDNLCLCVAADIDAHDSDANVGVNWQCVEVIAATFEPFKLTPVIFDSNGAGGYWVRAFFRKPIPAQAAFWFANLISSALAENGMPDVEIFPKQAQVTIHTPYGNFMRVPGKHHKRDHWTKIRDLDRKVWLEGEAAARALIRIKGDDPAELLKAFEAAQPQQLKSRRRSAPDVNGQPDEAKVSAALAHYPNSDVHYDEWLGVGMALNDWDSQGGLALWLDWSGQSKKFDEATTRRKWDSFSPGGGLTIASVFQVAIDRGWKPSSNGRPKPSCNGRDTAMHDHHRDTGGGDPASATESREWRFAESGRQTNGKGKNRHEWGEIQIGRIPEPIPFPVDVFPVEVQRYCEVVSKAVGCPIDLVGGAILGVASAAIGRSMSIMLKPGYFANAALWIAMIGPPGDGKSPVLENVGAPLREMDDILYQRYLADLTQWELDCAAAKKAKTALPKPPAHQRIDVDDITIESLQRIMCDNPRGLGWLCDEITTLVLGLNQYKAGGRGNDKPTLCKMWSGKPTKRDRANEHKRTPFSYLSVVGGINPDMLGELRDSRGRADGFLDRWLTIFPAASPVPQWSDVGIDEDVAESWKRIVWTLLRLDMQPHAETGQPVPHAVFFADEAKADFVRLYNLHVAEMNAPGFDPSLRGPWSKFREIVARLALVLHSLDWGANSVHSVHGSNIDSQPFSIYKVIYILKAFRLLDYCKSTFQKTKATIEGEVLSLGRAHNAQNAQNSEGVRALLHWLRETKRTEFSERDAYEEVGRFRRDRQSLTIVLGSLRRNCVIRRAARNEDGTGPGRPASPRWEVNPAFHRTEDAQNAQNSPPGSKGA